MLIREDLIFSVRDIIDSQLETRDEIEIGRVADIELEQREDGTLILVNLVVGPEALAGRVSRSLAKLFHWLLHGRFEQRIPLSEVEEFGPTLRLRKTAVEYPIGRSERWIASYILRWIPGSGYE